MSRWGVEGALSSEQTALWEGTKWLNEPGLKKEATKVNTEQRLNI